MTLKRLGIIGLGSIAQELLAVLARTLEQPLDAVVILVRPGSELEKQATLPHGAQRVANDCRCVGTVDDLMAAAPELVIECAGHQAVRDSAQIILSHGIEFVVTSTGVLSDASLHKQLRTAALGGDTCLTLPAGAVGGIDILAGIRHSGIGQVTYTSRKPPASWMGTPADKIIDLAGLKEAAVFYRGTARQAAANYPKNANTAATIALAGAGFDNTQVRLIADPDVSANIHEIDVSSEAGTFSIRIEGKPSSINPRTSLPTVYSLVREVLRRTAPVAI